MVPIHVPEHLVLGEQQRLERRHRLLLHANLESAGHRVGHEHDTLEESVHIHLAIGNAAESRVPPQVLHLVQVQAPADQATQGKLALTSDQLMDALRRVRPQRCQRLAESGRREELLADLLMVRRNVRLQLLEGV
jgi:hypothetical protein